MPRLFFTTVSLLLILVSVPVSAQTGGRPVKGVVQDENGQLIPDVKIKAETGEEFSPNSDGTFDIRVPFHCRSLSFSAPFYVETKKEIDGSYLLVRLKYDKAAEEKMKKESAAKERAEREAVQAAERAEKERIAAEEKVKKDAEAKAKAEADAKAKAERDAALAVERAEKKAKAEADAKAKAAAEARAKAERDSLWAIERAENTRIMAERKEREEAEVAARTAARVHKKDSLDKAYNSKFINTGFEQEISFTCAYNLSSSDFVYKYSGARHYDSIMPVEFDYSLNYKINRVLSVGLGTGLLFNARSVVIVGDEIVGSFKDASFKERRLDIPIIANAKVRLLRTTVRPMIQLSGGFYVLSKCPMVELALGAEKRISKKEVVCISGVAKLQPYPNSVRYGGYQSSSSLGIKTSFCF